MRPRFIILITGCALGALAAGLHRWRRSPEPQSLDAHPWPRGATSVLRTPLVESLGGGELDDSNVPDEAVWSYLAERMCGGYDVYGAAMEVAQRWRSLPRLQRYLAAPPREMREALACGKELADQLHGVRTTVRIDAPAWHELQLIASRAAPPRAASSLRSIGGLKGLHHAGCSIPWTAAGAECSPDARAVARLPDSDRWIFGSLDGLRAFSSVQGSGELNPFVSRIVSQLAQSLRDWPTVDLWLTAQAIFPPDDLLVSRRVSSRASQDLEALGDHLRWDVHAAASARRRQGTVTETRIELVAKGEPEAQRLTAEINAYRNAVLTALAKDRRDFTSETGPREHADYLHALSEAGARGWKEATIVRDGLHIIFSASTVIPEAERAPWQRYRSWRRVHALAAARIVNGLLHERPPSASDLVQLRGDALVAGVLQGYKPFFAGDWECYHNGTYSYWSYVGDKAYSGKNRSRLEGSYAYEIIEGSSLDAALQVKNEAGAKTLHISQSRFSSGISVGDGRASEPIAEAVHCSAIGDDAEHAPPPPAEEPGTIAPMIGSFRAGKGKIESEPDPGWDAVPDPKVVLDPSFMLVIGMGGGPHGWRTVTTIMGDGLGAHVYERDELRGGYRSTGVRRAEFRLSEAELARLVQVLNDNRFLSQPSRYVDPDIIDGAAWSMSVLTGGRFKSVSLSNAFPAPLYTIARHVADLIDQRPELDGLSQPVHGVHLYRGRGVQARLRPDYVGGSDARFQVVLLDRSDGGKELARTEGSWDAGGSKVIERAVILNATEPIDDTHLYEVVARIFDRDRELLGKHAAITRGHGQIVDVALRETRKPRD
jgi:hypothetical protein